MKGHRLPWRDLPGGIAVAAALLARGLCRRPPPPTTLAQRLAMLPLDGLPLVAPVSVGWDDHQIPFITAAHDTDLAVALGVVHCHLRRTQIEVLRRVAQGRVAEMVGPLGVTLDRTLRQIDIGRAVPAIIAGLPEATRRWAEGFVAGMNHHLRHAPSPHDCDLLGIGAEPWTLHDLFMLQRLISADITWMVWTKLLRLRGRMEPAAWRRLWPRLPDGGAPAAPDGRESVAGRALAAMARAGSNSAAVSGARTASGAAMIASDPHMPYRLPNPFLLAGMRAPGMHCVGLMIPGLPFVALGRSPAIAWGGTNLHAQSSDLIDASDVPPARVTTRETTIRVRWGRARKVRLRDTPSGPLVSDGLLLPAATPAALRWAGHRPSDELSAMLAVARSESWDDFRAALAGFGTAGLNMVFAGSDGRVGKLCAAHLPRRAHAPPPDLIVPPDAAPDWSRLATSDDLPSVVDPPDGYVVSANEAPPAHPFALGLFFAPPDRARRIAALLRDARRLTTADLRAIQTDVFGAGSLALRDALLAAAPPGAAPALLADLAAWDGRYAADSAGALAFELLLAEVARRLEDARRLGAYHAAWVTHRLLRDDIAAAPPAVLRACLARAAAAAAPRHRRFRVWGEMHRIAPRHPLAAIPLLGRRFRAPAEQADFPGEGGINTVHKTSHPLATGRHAATFGACARHVSDLATLDANHFVLLGGQDGWTGSANCADQVPIWRAGGHITLPLSAAGVRRHFRHVTTLRPAQAAG